MQAIANYLSDDIALHRAQEMPPWIPITKASHLHHRFLWKHDPLPSNAVGKRPSAHPSIDAAVVHSRRSALVNKNPSVAVDAFAGHRLGQPHMTSMPQSVLPRHGLIARCKSRCQAGLAEALVDGPWVFKEKDVCRHR